MAKIIASILIPTYNAEDFVRPTIDSVVNQDFDKDSYEIIFVDDGSRDNTVEILNSYKDKFKNLKIITQKNEGPSSALNHALKEANGDYLFFMSHDCIAEKYWLMDVIKEFEKDDKVAIVQGKLLPTKQIDLPIFHCNNFSSFQVTFDTAEVAYRKKAVEEGGKYFRDDFSTNGHDADLAWRVIEKGYRYIWLDKVLMYHEVLPRGFWRDIKNYHLMQYFPKLIKIHPGMRRSLKFRILWGSVSKYVFIAGLLISLLLVANRNFSFSLLLLLFTFGFSIFRVLRLSRTHNITLGQKLMIVFPHLIICEALLGFFLIFGTIKYRSLVI